MNVVIGPQQPQPPSSSPPPPGVPATSNATRNPIPKEPKPDWITAIEDAVNKAPGTSLSSYLLGMNIDVSDPAVQDLLDDPAFQVAFKKFESDPVNGKVFLDAVTKLQIAYPSTSLSQYSQTFISSGASELPPMRAEPSATAGGVPYGIPPEQRDYQLTSTGAIYYTNGVIADPNSGQVTFPPNDASVAGSSLWMRDAQSNWSEEKVKQWKTKLVQAGYLPKGSAKDGAWNATFMQALQTYQQNRYLNYGTPIVQDPSAAGGAAEITNLRTVRASISEDIRSQYVTMFNQQPSQAELQQWTDFIIRTGNKLQRKGLAAGSAADEARARALQSWRSSPVGQYQQQTEENTQLRDSLVAAASAAGSVIGQ